MLTLKPPSRARTIAVAALFAAPAFVLATPAPGSAATGDTLWTTGLGSDGQLGLGNTASRTTFAQIPNFTDVDEVAGGREHVVALVGGQVWTWGDGSKGATGQSTSADISTPRRITSLSGVTNVSTGHYHSLALMGDGTVRAWGFNSMGQLGDGTTTKRTAPVSVRAAAGTGLLTGVKDIVAGRDMSYALLTNGTVMSWGGGINGELGNGSRTEKQTRPVAVTGLTGITALAGGRNHGLALKADGTVWAWGLNTSGRLGDGTQTLRTTPIQVSGITTTNPAVAVSAGADHSVALLADGRVMTWGEGSRGQLGSGRTSDRLIPAFVTGVSNVRFIGCGRDTTLAVTASGQLWDWGFNDAGQLGDGTLTRRLSPVQIPGITNAIEAHGGRGYTVVRRGPAA